jgi:hypothetical protein
VSDSFTGTTYGIADSPFQWIPKCDHRERTLVFPAIRQGHDRVMKYQKKEAEKCLIYNFPKGIMSNSACPVWFAKYVRILEDLHIQARN